MNTVTAVRINQNEIRELIPHSGSMCLLESVLAWDEQSIVCTSRTHLLPTNPLRRDEKLSAIHAFEYGAQTVAIHGGLRARAAGTSASPGYLAAFRDASVKVGTLDQFTNPLVVRANSLFSDHANSVYKCVISAGDTVVAQGRVTIILRRSTLSRPLKPDLDFKDGLPLTTSSVPRTLAAAVEIDRRVPIGHPSLPGHFPGEPIVPAVVILDEVAAALAQWRPSRITHIHFAKFLSPLKPEQIFTVSFATPSSPTQITFQCQAENRAIAEGRFDVARYD
jgi:predicted hotdog family 3-hydroxylacyl-ACP dehydratase